MTTTTTERTTPAELAAIWPAWTWNEHRVFANNAGVLSRAEYEALSAAFGFPTATDEGILRNEPWARECVTTPFDTDPYVVIRRGRLNGIDRERDERATARRRLLAAIQRPPARCERCGAETPHLMHASLGTVCPDCYDEWS